MGSRELHEQFDYSTYEQAVEGFDWDQKWDAVDGSREEMNITHECLDRHPADDTALRIKYRDGPTERYTFGDVGAAASRFAHLLADRGVDPGDPVAVMIEPRFELYASLFGTLNRGAKYVPLFTLFGPEAIRYRVEDSDAELLVTTAEQVEDVPEDLDAGLLAFEDDFGSRTSGYPGTYEPLTSGEDVSIVQYTSGTTGEPNGVEMRHKSITNLVPHVKFGYGLRASDRFFCTSPPAWAHGIWIGTFAPLMFGNAAGAYSGPFEPGPVLDGLESLGITNLAATPTALRKLVNSGLLSAYDLDLERVGAGGERLDANTRTELRERLGVSVADIYGFSEYGAVIMNYNGFDEWQEKRGSIGKPLPGLEVAVIDDDGDELPPDTIGEIAVRHKGDWLRSGDAGVVDEDGYFWYKGRIDDVIISAGYRIDPTEVEDALFEHPAVGDAAVVASPDEERGNVVKAFVRPTTSDTEGLKEELQTKVKADLSGHEYPREIEFVSSFPRTESNKIKRKELRERERRRKADR